MIVLYCLALLPIGVTLSLAGYAGWVFAAGAIVLSGGLLAVAVQLYRTGSGRVGAAVIPGDGDLPAGPAGIVAGGSVTAVNGNGWEHRGGAEDLARAWPGTQEGNNDGFSYMKKHITQRQDTQERQRLPLPQETQDTQEEQRQRRVQRGDAEGAENSRTAARRTGIRAAFVRASDGRLVPERVCMAANDAAMAPGGAISVRCTTPCCAGGL